MEKKNGKKNILQEKKKNPVEVHKANMKPTQTSPFLSLLQRPGIFGD